MQQKEAQLAELETLIRKFNCKNFLPTINNNKLPTKIKFKEGHPY